MRIFCRFGFSIAIFGYERIHQLTAPATSFESIHILEMRACAHISSGKSQHEKLQVKSIRFGEKQHERINTFARWLQKEAFTVKEQLTHAHTQHTELTRKSLQQNTKSVAIKPKNANETDAF